MGLTIIPTSTATVIITATTTIINIAIIIIESSDDDRTCLPPGRKFAQANVRELSHIKAAYRYEQNEYRLKSNREYVTPS